MPYNALEWHVFVQMNVKRSGLMLNKVMDKLQQKKGNAIMYWYQASSLIFLQIERSEMEVAGITDNFYLNGATPVRERQKMVETFRGGDKHGFSSSSRSWI